MRSHQTKFKCRDEENRLNAAIALLCFIRLLSPFTLFCLTFARLSLTKDAENVFRLSFGVFHRLSPTFTAFWVIEQTGWYLMGLSVVFSFLIVMLQATQAITYTRAWTMHLKVNLHFLIFKLFTQQHLSGKQFCNTVYLIIKTWWMCYCVTYTF